MLRKTMIIASMAAAAVALAVPAGASATWGEKTVAITGPVGFHSNIGGITCNETHGTATLTADTTGHATSFNVTNATTKCTGHGGLAFCTVHVVEALNLNWPIDKSGHNITVTNVTIRGTNSGAFCPYHELHIEGEAKLTPVGGSNPSAVTNATFGKGTNFMTIRNGTTLHSVVTSEATPTDTVHLTPTVAVT
jgi:hypothetical protein